MKKVKKPAVLIAGVIAVLVIFGLFFFFRKSGDSERVVYVMPVSADGSGYLSDRYSGVVEAQASVDFKKDPDKTVLEIYVSVGDSVSAGDALFKYDTAKSENEMASARLELEGFDNEIAALNNEISELTRQRDEASDSEKLDYTTEIQSKQMQIRQKQYEKQIKQNDMAKLQNEIDHSVVKSTISGVVKQINDDGNGESDKPFMSVTQTGQFRVKGTLNEEAVSSFSAGQAVLIRSRTDESGIWKGVVSQIEKEPEANNSSMGMESSAERSSRYPFYVTPETTEGLMLGQHVYIEPDYGQSYQEDGIWLDAGYIVFDDSGNAYVWAADKNDRLKKRKITVGELDGDTLMYEVTGGLEREDRIAWPDDTLRDGLRVTSGEDASAEEFAPEEMTEDNGA